MLNENNYTNEDCVLILRTILNKSKRLLNIIEENNKTKILTKLYPPIDLLFFGRERWLKITSKCMEN